MIPKTTKTNINLSNIAPDYVELDHQNQLKLGKIEIDTKREKKVHVFDGWL
jgi:hypothetical protein